MLTNILAKNKLLLLFVGLAIAIRLAYFPENVYFAFDQARDAFAALEVTKGDIKVIGPPSAASDKLFPGPLVYYLLGPIYALFNKSPEAVSAFLRIYNALGTILVFAIGSTLFNRKIALVAALFFAVSYEQSQYSLFISHQPMAVLPVLLLYLGLALFLFKKQKRGLAFAAIGWGLSIQFHYVYILLAPILLTLAVIFKKRFLILKVKDVVLLWGVFLATLSTYILAEIKFDFRFVRGLFLQTTSFNQIPFHMDAVIFATKRFLHDTFLANYDLILVPSIFVLIAFFYLARRGKTKAAFIALWFAGGIFPYGFSGSPSYYYSTAASVSLLLVTANFAAGVGKKKLIFGFTIIAGILLNNIYLIRTMNPKGPNSDIVIQPGMLVSSQKKALDYIYSTASGQPFAVKGLTIPLNINTTWSYLFEWYGQQKYNYLPIWIGPTAAGFSGNLQVGNDRSKLPKNQFLIIEPTIGILPSTSKEFLKEEGYFTRVVEEKSFGTITVQRRQKI